MIRVCQIQNGITQQHQQLFVLTVKCSSQRLFTSLGYNSVSDPLPELSLCRPKLFPVAADDQRCFLLPFFLFGDCRFVSAHVDTLVPLRGRGTQKPIREASLARQHLIVKNLRTEFPAPDYDLAT